MNVRFLMLLTVLVAFTAYSVEIVMMHGLFGFLAAESLDHWGLQVLLDLGLALVSFTTLAIPDAKRRGITYWPYLVATVALGSIGVLAYLARRELRESAIVKTA